jgi:hypothetical protein
VVGTQECKRERHKMKRHLRKSIEITLTIITMAQILFVITINDFNLSAIPTILLTIAMIVLNIYILAKYGRGLALENDN